MKTSARNQFCGRVSAIQTGPINAEVDIDLNGKGKIVAVITHESVGQLGLKVGGEAWALVKAPWIIVTPDDPTIRLSTRNRLCGTIAKLVEGAVNSEVQIELASGDIVTATITNESVNTLGLAEGARACAVFKANSVIVGVTV
ncbi:MAG: TOBE domain-containing protein [Sulfuricellaceae bacterium]